jgi:hypothetical protein
MILDFPANPNIGQIYIGANNITYTWDGTRSCELWITGGPIIK